MRNAFTLLLAAALLAACGAVDSVHPLSDATTTALDPDLIGYWGASPDEGGPWQPDEVRPVFTVGRTDDDPKALEVAFTQLAEGRLEVVRLRLLPTVIDGRRYLSLRNLGEEDGRYLFLRYAFEDDGRWLRLDGCDVAFFAKAVMDGALEGTVEGDDEDLSLRTVHLGGSTAALREWVKAHADEAFVRGRPRALQRLREREFEIGGDAEKDAAEAPPAPPPPPPAPPAPEAPAPR